MPAGMTLHTAHAQGLSRAMATTSTPTQTTLLCSITGSMAIAGVTERAKLRHTASNPSTLPPSARRATLPHHALSMCRCLCRTTAPLLTSADCPLPSPKLHVSHLLTIMIPHRNSSLLPSPSFPPRTLILSSLHSNTGSTAAARHSTAGCRRPSPSAPSAARAKTVAAGHRE